ncbi:MAG: NERD domain-containing protein [Anaerolineae bacterium]
MAEMYPQQLDPDTESAAERRLYGLFRDQLADDYIVFHSVAWQALDGGRRRDGEADFLILHPKNGILVLEVKGGLIVHDRRKGQWHSIDRRGAPHRIKDPVKQALQSKYCFVDLLSELTGTPRRRINIGHAAAFPDVHVTAELVSPELPPAILMGENHLHDVPGWVRGAMDHYRGASDRASTAPGTEILATLLELLGKTIHLKPAMWGQMRLERAQLAELTRQQYLLLDALSRRNQALIAGCAGSGKTMLAAEKACRLAASGFETLLTCFNKNLAAFLRSRLGERRGLNVKHFHELGYALADAAGTLPGKPVFDDTFFSEVLPGAMLEALDVLADERYDAIVVDEGQDFEDAWWIPLQSMLRDPETGIFYIFYDEAQSLYNQEMALPIADEPYVLDINCRNTRQIQNQVQRFSSTPMRQPRHAVDGRPVHVLRYARADGLPSALAPVIQRLVTDDRVPLGSVVLLSPLSSRNPHSELVPGARIGSFKLTNDIEPGDGEIRRCTIHGFKGCESDVVVLLEADGWQEERARDALMYVATSRARHHLIVALPDDAPADLAAQFG